ncbi:glycine cleavage T C-terminal barrel domain-containing protein [Jannaschia rubra]|uniref:glycine cleavage T C-terminal barrel domain-containing protein n=1 Tax=Jannaschia rubra TaxID=282197 RepID=UPI0024913EBE|nr:glycine cleavage T C-terminal barrel domain-containing protein [Jannaschia rubra]
MTRTPCRPVSLGGGLVDEVTSTAFGHRIGKPVAMVILSCAGAPPGTEVEVQVFGRRIPARVHGDAPLYDPANERLRA